jgi:hypothetical protein
MADADILFGPGKIYRAPLAEADPDETTIDYDEAWGGNWTDMGDLLEGQPVTLSIVEEIVKVYTERSTAAKNAVRTRREMMVKTTFAEHSVANMAILLDGTAATTAAGASQKGFSDIPIHDLAEVQFYKWGIEGFRKDAAGNEQPVRWFLPKGYIRLAGDVAYAKQNPTGVPVEISLLGDSSQAATARLGKLQIVTAAATS